MKRTRALVLWVYFPWVIICGITLILMANAVQEAIGK